MKPNDEQRRLISRHKLQRTDKTSNFFRMLTRTFNHIAASASSASILESFKYVLLFSIAVNIIDSSIKLTIEMNTNVESGLLHAFKLFVPLASLGLAVTCLFALTYTPILNAFGMLLGALNKWVDVAVAYTRGLTHGMSAKIHDCIVATAIFAGAALMLTVAPTVGEVLLLAASYYYVIDAFGWNPVRKNTSTNTDAPSTPAPPLPTKKSDENELALQNRPTVPSARKPHHYRSGTERCRLFVTPTAKINSRKEERIRERERYARQM